MTACAYDCLQGDLGAGDNQHIGQSTHQFSRGDEWTACIVNAAIFNDNVLSFAKAILFQLRRKLPIVLRHPQIGAGLRAEKSYSECFVSLLCESTKRPRRCGAPENSKKFPSPHSRPPRAQTRNGSNSRPCSEVARSPRRAMSALGQKQTCAVH